VICFIVRPLSADFVSIFVRSRRVSASSSRILISNNVDFFRERFGRVRNHPELFTLKPHGNTAAFERADNRYFLMILLRNVLERPGIPDHHRACAIFAIGNDAFGTEVQVSELKAEC
jgi:hypothetical protein